MEHVSEVIPRTLAALAPGNGSAAARSNGASAPFPTNLPELIQRFEHDESLENPDVVVPLRDLHMTAADTVQVPRLGEFTFTEWSRGQCASLLGVKYDRWFRNASPEEKADELNQRLSRATETVRVRTTQAGEEGHDGTLIAFVSPGFSPIRDSAVGRLLQTALEPVDPELKLIRANTTDKTVSYVLRVGTHFRVGDDHEVGDLSGGLLVRNSGVGFASLLMSLHLTRLICKNGMTAPVPDALFMRRRHRGIDLESLRELIVERLSSLPARLRQGAENLRRARTREIANVRDAVVAFLSQVKLPRRLVEPILAAHGREPELTLFGLIQAVTRAAQEMTPEDRLDLETAAGRYIATL